MTNRPTLPATIAAALVLASATPGFAADKAVAKSSLQGKWEAQFKGQPMTMSFAVGKFTIHIAGKGTMSGKYKTDTTKSPKHLDLSVTGGEPKVIGKSVLCIYEAKGNKLRFCGNDPLKANPRATKFPEKQGSKQGYLYLVFDRRKKAAIGKADGNTSAKPELSADLKKLQGDWKMVTAKMRGQNAPPEFLKTKLNVKGDTFTLIRKIGGKIRQSPIRGKLNTAKTPRQIDFIKKDGTVDSVGIYKLDGDKVSFCFDRKKRPAKFESPAGSQATLFVFKRVK